MDHSRAIPRAIAIPPVVDEVTAEEQDKALAVVQRLLRERGIRARCHHKITLGLISDGEAPWPDRASMQSWLKRYSPELVVTGSQGWCDATVSVGPRSGCYLVALRDESGLQKVRGEHPEKVVDLILAVERRS
ncbi:MULTISPECIES: hypothetical protein [Streptosporangium]|uniref:Uncharacterized protein n=1 Tax=Streptosporangium brasiliense TaxID=47480 RepID=A0ABT9RAS1_9ACTN|nr:hypothetical protein [Streptosporangium brasiliense]MDP9866354.1 hypothetical protein [Streptosporangium brasiliense]